MSRLLADFVAKRFCASERARLIQDQAPMRNIDSRIQSLRFDRCVFLFYSLSAVTFATKSATSRLARSREGLSNTCLNTEHFCVIRPTASDGSSIRQAIWRGEAET